MRVIVTGATGFVGAHVSRALLAAGDEVYAVARGGRNAQDLVARGVHWINADVLTSEGRSSIAAVGADACVHTAWCAEPGKYLSAVVNIEFMTATIALAQLLAAAGCKRFVGLGTCFEYDTDVGYLSERSPLAPKHIYSAAKVATHLVLDRLPPPSAMEVCWARLFYLYGPDEHPNRLVPSIVRALLRGDEAKSTHGRQVRDFLHVEDAASGICAVLRSDIVGAINVASGQPVSVERVARTLAEHCGRPDLLCLGALTAQPGDPPFICADIRKILSGTKWSPLRDLSGGLDEAVAWWRKTERPSAQAGGAA